ncbi:hypothetical protein ECPA14_6063, partial [Escherichia coli PA14]
MKAPPHLRLKP